ncbi:MAG TPA: hypothetical protein VG474_11310 [Solirubrobacteraceae bacterium]|nr:hypothetical protein [Solirubrobacteraceae bacterium]
MIARTAAVLTVVAMSAGAGLSAVAGKVMNQIGLPKIKGKELKFDIESLATAVLAPADGAGQETVLMAIVGIFALLFLAAIIYFVFGLIQGLRGARGGVETAFSVVAALVIAIVGFQVLA